MTATERVRELLDELRKLACDINEKEIRSHSVITLNQGRYNRQFRLDMNHDWLNAWHAELERILQAIAATLGSSSCTNGERTGTCQITPQFTCSECGYQYPIRNYECYETCDGRTAYASLGYDVLDCEKPNYCPNCGRKVVDA